jgi:hypothetical protein
LNKRHPVFDVYFFELLWLAHRLKADCEFIFEETKPPEAGKHYIKVSIPVHEKIENVCLAAARLKKLVQTPTGRHEKESAAEYAARQLRAKALREVLSDVTLDEILETKVRDSIEHFDEYLDTMNVGVASGKIAGPAAAYNMVISDAGTFDRPLYPIRLYLADSKKFSNMRYSINLGKIHDEASAILARLKSLGTFPSEPGGLIIKFPTPSR